MRLGGDARMQRESADLAGVAFERIRIDGDRLQRRDLAPCVLAGGDAVSDRTHPQCVQAVVAACAVGQKGGFGFAFEPASARQMPAHPVRDLAGQLRQLRGRRRSGSLNARLIRQSSRDHAMHDPQHRADGFGLAGEQEAQRIRKT